MNYKTELESSFNKLSRCTIQEAAAVLKKLGETVRGMEEEDLNSNKDVLEKCVNMARENIAIRLSQSSQIMPELTELSCIIERLDLKKHTSDKLKKIIFEHKKDKKTDNTHENLTRALRDYQVNQFYLPIKAAKKKLLMDLFSLPCEITQEQYNVLSYMLPVIYFDIPSLVESLKANIFNNKLKALDIKKRISYFTWFNSIFWNSFVHEKGFKEVYNFWLEIFYDAMKRDDREYVFYLHFPLSHIYLNSSQTQDEFAKFEEEVEKPFSNYIKTICQKEGLSPQKRSVSTENKIKVGILMDRAVYNSPMKLVVSFLSAVQSLRDKYEFHFYDLEYVEKSASDPKTIQFLNRLCDSYTSNHKLIEDANAGLAYNHYKKSIALREKIISDEIDVLLLSGNSREQFNFLFTSRAAPIQLYWSHGHYVYNIPNIDDRLLYGTPNDSSYYYELFGYNYFFFGHYVLDGFYNPPVPQPVINQERLKYPQDKVILGFIGRLVKMCDEEYLDKVIEIMKRCENTIFIACGIGSKSIILEKINQAGLQDRFFFPGTVNPHVYGNIIDIMLDTFPLKMGEALNEFWAKGKPSVIYQKDLEESYNLHLSTFICAQELIPCDDADYLIENSEFIRAILCKKEDYIGNACRLIEDNEYRAKIGHYMKLRQDVLFSQDVVKILFEKVIQKNIEKHNAEREK